MDPTVPVNKLDVQERHDKSGMILREVFLLKKLSEWVGAIYQMEGDWRRSRCGLGHKGGKFKT